MLLLEAGEVINRIKHILSLVGVRCCAARKIRLGGSFLTRWHGKVALIPQHESMFASQSTDAQL